MHNVMYPLEQDTVTIGHHTPVKSRETATVMARDVTRASAPSLAISSRKRPPPSHLEESEFDHDIQATTPAPTYNNNSSSGSSSSEPSTQQQQTPLQTPLFMGSSSSCSEDMGSSSSPDILAGGSTDRCFRFGDLVDPFHGRMSTIRDQDASPTARAAPPLNGTTLDAGPSPSSPSLEMRGGDEDSFNRVLSRSPGHCSTTLEDFSIPGHDDISRSRKGKKRRRTNSRRASSSAREGEATTHATATTTSSMSSSSSYANQSHFYPRPPGRRQEEGEGQARNRRAGAGADGPIEPDVAFVAASSTSPFSLDGPTQRPSENCLTPASSSSAAPLSVSSASSSRRTTSSAQSTTSMSVDSVEVLDLSKAPSMEVIDVDDDAEGEDGTRTALSPVLWRHPLSVAAREGGSGVQERGRGSGNGASSSSGVEVVSRGWSSTAQPQQGMGGAAAGRRSLMSRTGTSAEAFVAATHAPRSARAEVFSLSRRCHGAVDAATELDGNTGDDEAVTVSASPATRRRRARADDGERLAARIQNQESRLQEQSDAAMARQLQSEEERHISAAGGWRNFIAGAVGDPMVDIDWLGGDSGYADVGDSSEQEEQDVEEIDHVCSHACCNSATVGNNSGGHGAGATTSISSQGRGSNSRRAAASAEGEAVISVGAGEGRRNASASTTSQGRRGSRAESSHAAAARESNSGAGRSEGARAGANRRGASARGGSPAGRGAHGHMGARGGGRSSAADARRRRQHSSENGARSEGQFAIMMSNMLASLEPYIGGIRGGEGGGRGARHGRVGGSAAHMSLMSRNLTSADYQQLLALDDDVQGSRASSGRKGLTDVELSMLPTQKGNGSGEIEQCCICMDDMKPRQSITRLPACLHTFHSKCISKWLKGQATCPIDKARVSVSGP